ncbi:MAG: ATP synthase F1 subunit delta [Candidatus Omnitrophota bacterium]|nr:ATP synthase F1 subunit delta [Candidatus Omnitrophota bacterium]MDZ4243336.1 ATP synthase F1 subunit delta [Candidatus Omnitrophota bacterium]
MKNSKAAKRYARAFFELCKEGDAFDDAYADLSMIRQAVGDSAELAAFLKNVHLPREKRESVLAALFQTRVRPLTMDFLLFLDRKNRLPAMPQICEYFEKDYFAQKGILKVKITTATALDSGQEEAIRDRLRQRYQKDIRWESELVPGLIGGFKIQVEDLIHDLSVQNQLQKFKNRIMNS